MPALLGSFSITSFRIYQTLVFVYLPCCANKLTTSIIIIHKKKTSKISQKQYTSVHYALQRIKDQVLADSIQLILLVSYCFHDLTHIFIPNILLMIRLKRLSNKIGLVWIQKVGVQSLLFIIMISRFLQILIGQLTLFVVNF